MVNSMQARTSERSVGGDGAEERASEMVGYGNILSVRILNISNRFQMKEP